MIRNIKRIFNILNINEKKKLSIVVFLTILVTIFEMIGLGVIPVYVTFIIDPDKLLDFISDFKFLYFINNFSNEQLLFYFSFFLVGVFIFKNMFISFFYLINGFFLKKLNSRISNEIYNNYLYADYLFYINKTSAEFTRNLAEVTRFVGLIGHYIRLLLELLVLLFIIIITIKIDPFITLISLIIFGFFASIYIFFIKNWLSNAGLNMQKFSKNQINILNQTYSAIKEIKINLKEKYMYNLFSKNIFRMNNIVLFNDILKRLPKLILEVVGILFVVLVSLYFIFFKSSNTELISLLSYFAVATIRLVPAFTSITNSTSSIKYMEPSINIIEKEMKILKDLNIENVKNEDRINLKINNLILKDITVDNLSYHYPTQNELIKDLNINISKNQKIGIIGESGSGKTTFLNLILGLIKNTKGLILYNDMNISDHKSNIYQHLGYVPQDTILFNDSIINNITFGNNLDNKKNLNNIIKMVRLEKFIKDLPNGLETTLGERGINISGGQRQRIGLARALYKDPQIIIFDEATSALDIENEKLILNDIFNSCKNKILIIISHRRETLKDCDKIYELKNGKFVIK